MTTHRFSTAEYYRLGELGMLSERTELIEGVISDMEPIGPWHGSVNDMLVQLFTLQARNRYVVRSQAPIDLGPQSLPQPDLVLYRPGRYRDRHPTPPDIYLAVEISQSSLNVDLGQKRDLYKAAGIAEYWVIDLEAQCVHRFCAPDYERQSFAESISPLLWPDIKIDLRELLR